MKCRHQGIHDRMGMQRMRREGVEGAPRLVPWTRRGKGRSGTGVFACSFGLWRVYSSKIAIFFSMNVFTVTPKYVCSVCLVFINHPCPKMGAAASGSHEVVA